MATGHRNLVEVAQNLAQRSTDFNLAPQDAQDIQQILSRFLDLERQRQNAVQSQVAYRKRIAVNDPDTYQKRKQQEQESFHKKYQNDDMFRERLLAKRRERYAQKKNSV